MNKSIRLFLAYILPSSNNSFKIFRKSTQNKVINIALKEYSYLACLMETLYITSLACQNLSILSQRAMLTKY